MNDMPDDHSDDQLQDAAREYNSPPETPRAEMWERIVAARSGGSQERGNAEAGKQGDVLPFKRSLVPSFPRSLRWPVGIAALLALGIGLGRMSLPRPEAVAPPAIATEVAPRKPDMAYQVVTTEHLGQSEAFLTLFRASVRRGGNEPIASATARQLLATNRLLLDSPAAADDRTRLLLQDLELVLAQIAQLSPRPGAPDLDLITEGLEDGGVMSRLRTAVPSGASTTQGVL
jgi:hypothetical protein